MKTHKVSTKVGADAKRDGKVVGSKEIKYDLRVPEFESMGEMLTAQGERAHPAVDATEFVKLRKALEPFEKWLVPSLSFFNARNAQDAKQGPKEPIRDCLRRLVIGKFYNKPEEVKEAQADLDKLIAEHQKAAPNHVSGGGRGPSGEVTKTAAGDTGKALLDAMGVDQFMLMSLEKLGEDVFREFCEAKGLDPAKWIEMAESA